MKISFVIPVYNGAAFLSQTIGSLKEQTYQDTEIIIVDDHSSDDIAPLKDFYKEIKWISLDKRSGAAYCRNLGNRNISGDIIAVCDAGDIYMPNRASTIAEFFDVYPDKDIFYSSVQVNTAYDAPLYVQDAKEWDGKSKCNISHPTVAYRKKVIEKAQYHEETLDSDLFEFFLLDCMDAGFKLGFSDKILCVKRDLTNSRSYRDIKNGKDIKMKKYKERGIEIPQEMMYV